MIRSCLEFLLSRSLDDAQTDRRKSPAPWLQRRVQRDDQLEQFDTEARQLDSLLRSSAAEQRQAMATGAMASDENVAVVTLPPHRLTTSAASSTSSSRAQSVRWFSGLAVAALLLFALSRSWSPNGFHAATPEVHAGEFSQQLAVAPREVLRLINRAAETSQTQLPRLSPLANFSLPAMPAWETISLSVESPALKEIDTWQNSWQNLKSRWSIAPQEL